MELALGGRIHIARTRCKKSQVELARDVGISKTTLSDIETGNTVAPSSAIITDIARGLNVSADFLLGLRDEPDRGGRLHVALPTSRQERHKPIIRPTPATVSVTAVAPTGMGMSINEHGFLSPEILGYQPQIRNQYAGYFDLIHRVNTFCQETQCRLSVHNHDTQETSLMIQLLHNVQGSVLLLERGLASQARILLRAGLEALILLQNVCDHEEFCRAFILASERDRLKLQRAIQANPAPVFDAVRPHITQQTIEKLATELATAEVSSQTIKELARLAGLQHLYDSMYRLFSQDVHTSARTLERYLVFDEASGDVQTFAWGPETTDMHVELMAVVALMLACFACVAGLFSLDLGTELSEFNAELRALDEPATG
jgi:transcriptional regulator with XRE-family HTH domain